MAAVLLEVVQSTDAQTYALFRIVLECHLVCSFGGCQPALRAEDAVRFCHASGWTEIGEFQTRCLGFSRIWTVRSRLKWLWSRGFGLGIFDVGT